MERIVLTWKKGINPKTRKEQWQARVQDRAGVTVYVPHYDCSSLPERDGEQWICAVVEQIDQSQTRRGLFRVVVVWLVRKNLATPDQLAALKQHCVVHPGQPERPLKAAKTPTGPYVPAAMQQAAN